MVEKNINTKEYWDKRWRENPMLSRKLEKLLMAAVYPELSVLDIGCGTGRILRGLRKDKDCRVYGIDISQVSIDMLKRQGINGEVANAEDLDFFRGKFDVVIISHTLEHIDNDDKLIMNIARITDCYALIAVPNNMIPPEEEKEHRQLCSLAN